MMPPWLWLWLAGDLAVLIPAEVSNERHQIALYTGHGEIAPQVTAGTPYTLLLLFTILSALTCAIFAAGVIATMFPQLRGRRVERRLGPIPDGDEVALAEMQFFASQYDPSIRLRATTRDDQLARIYPVSWRTARIAVFRPLPALWGRDREAAQAVLLREMTHRRHGDQLVVGLGSPLVWLMRLWVPAFVVLALAPVVVYAALGGGLLTQAVTGQGALQLLQPVGLLILPVTALWLAELATPTSCSRLLACRSGLGFGDKVQAETDLNRLLAARTSADARNDFSALMAATAAGLRRPPPGAVGGGYVTALTDFRTAGLDLRDDRVNAALVATQNGITADQKATTMLTAQLGQCRR